MNAWGSVELKCDDDEVEAIKIELKANRYCYSLSKNPETGVYTFTVYIIANLSNGTVGAA